MTKKIMVAAKLAIGAAIVLYLVHFVGIGETYKTLRGVKLTYLPLIIAVFLFGVGMRALNFKALLLSHENEGKTALAKQIGLRSLVKISFVSWAAGMFTPGKLGEFSSIYLLKKEGINTGKSAAISLLNKAVTTFTILVFAIIGLVKFMGVKESAQLIVIFFAITLLPYGLITSAKTRGLIKKILCRLLGKHEQHISGFTDELDTYLARRKKLLLYNFALNVAWIAVSSWLFSLAFAAVGQSVGFVDILLVNSIGTTTSFIPITIGGTGLREASALVFFGMLGINSAAVLGSHLIIAAISYTIAGAVALAFIAGKNQ